MGVLRWLIEAIAGERREVLEEEGYPRDAMGRPDLARFTRPIAHYTAYFDGYLASLRSRGSTASQGLAYRKSVLGQWGLIAKGPREALPYVRQLLSAPEPEARSAAAGVLEAWIEHDASLVPAVLEAAQAETDSEALTTLIGALARARTRHALPLLARLLRDPASRRGDVHWAVVEALSRIAGRHFELSEAGLAAADQWLREQGA